MPPIKSPVQNIVIDPNGFGFVAGWTPTLAGGQTTDPVFRQRVGIFGRSGDTGVFGQGSLDAGTGVYGVVNGTTGDNRLRGSGVRGETQVGVGVQGQCFDPSGLAGRFYGTVEVHGDIHVRNGGDIFLENQDCAENFEVADVVGVEAGSVMIIEEGGLLTPCRAAYDKRVAGVISGAGNYKPAIILGSHAALPGRRTPIALLGKTFCKVDAGYGPIEMGDLLTTSETVGHAMKVQDAARALGCIIGKALQPLSAGVGLVPILIALQ